jgi:hypothetical protein
MVRVCVVLVAILLLGLAGRAEAGHAKNCGVIANVKGERDYRVRANGASCDFARTWSRRYIRRGRRPSGWSCSKPGGKISFYCRRGDKYYYAQRA